MRSFQTSRQFALLICPAGGYFPQGVFALIREHLLLEKYNEKNVCHSQVQAFKKTPQRAVIRHVFEPAKTQDGVPRTDAALAQAYRITSRSRRTPF